MILEATACMIIDTAVKKWPFRVTLVGLKYMYTFPLTRDGVIEGVNEGIGGRRYLTQTSARPYDDVYLSTYGTVMTKPSLSCETLSPSDQ